LKKPHSLDAIIEDVRREHVPDLRIGVFDVRAEDRNGLIALVGESTHARAVTVVVERLRAQGLEVVDEVLSLPGKTLGEEHHALVCSAIAPLYAAAMLPAPQISQLVLGMRVQMLARDRDWVRVRGEDGYIGWVYRGYLREGDEEWAYAWERGTAGESVVSLGAELLDENGGILARLPWGARIARHTGLYQLPDGRRGKVANGEVIDVGRLSDWFPPRGESVARTARRWLGAPYLWGGVTLNGVDCSGFTQAVMWLHGIALPRDSDLQERIGTPIDPRDDVRAGDLVYFAESTTRISHVAISLGGSLIVHSALSRGGVDINDLAGSEPLEERLRTMLVSGRRLLPD